MKLAVAQGHPGRLALTLLVTVGLAGCVARVPAPPAVDALPGPEVAAPSAAAPAQLPAESPLVARGFSLINTKLELPAESPLAGQKFSLLSPKLTLPPLPDSPQSQSAVPLDTSDPRYTEYFAELRRRVDNRWAYPPEASRKGQSGQGEIRLVLRKDGSVKTVEIVRSSGVKILDAYIERAIRLAQPFPPIPASVPADSVPEDGMPITINFSYVLGNRPPSPSP